MWIIIIAVLALCILLYIYCIAPNNGRKDKMTALLNTYIAHRGLFNDTDAPENSIPSFKLAVEKGYGIELDVQLTTDNKLVVFHDENIERMCGSDVILRKCSFEQIQKYKLGNSKEKIPLLEDVLNIINGKVPLIVEIKPEGNWKKTSRMLAEMMDKYNGFYCVQSFHPWALGWFKKNRPEIVRGQLSTNFSKDHVDRKWYEKAVMPMLTNLLFNFKSRPDFISYNLAYADQFSYCLCRKLYKVVCAAWTVRSSEDLEKAKKLLHQIIIFDDFFKAENQK